MYRPQKTGTAGMLLAFLLTTALAGIAWGTVARAGAGPDDHEQGHEEGHGEEHDEGGALVMPAAEREALGIRTARAEARALAGAVSAPGEVRVNAYRTAQVTPRISAQVVARMAYLGDPVEAGQPLVRLSSVEMAEAQGTLIEADREWNRVRRLGRGVVSEKRYVAAQVARQRAWATALAYGMTEAQVKELLAGGDTSRATGEFELLAPRDGTVIQDPFVVGEVIEPGRLLFEITDEKLLWAEARLRPEQADNVSVGVTARLSRDGSRWLQGEVVQLHHRVDEVTRTQSVRIEFANRDDALHPGDYVEVVLETDPVHTRIAVPKEAVVLMQGAPTVFVVEGDELHPRPLETGVTLAGWTEIRAGLAAGEEVVTQGAFLLKSLTLKSQMGEGHAH